MIDSLGDRRTIVVTVSGEAMSGTSTVARLIAAQLALALGCMDEVVVEEHDDSPKETYFAYQAAKAMYGKVNLIVRTEQHPRMARFVRDEEALERFKGSTGCERQCGTCSTCREHLDHLKAYETCLACGKHCSRHFGGTEARCEPAY